MKSRKRTILFAVLGILILLSAFSYLYLRYADSVPREDIRHFSKDTYDSIFLSMHSTADYSQEDFATYHGLNTVISSHEIQNMDEMNRYLKAAFSSGNTISHIFLLVDPVMIWESCEQDSSQWDKSLQDGLFSFVSQNPSVNFEILLPYPSLPYWLERDQAELEDALSLYHAFIEAAYEYDNTRTFYMGFENWMLGNPDNYVSDFDVNDVIARKIFLTCFCDGAYQITPINDEILFNRLLELIARERTQPTVYPDLSDRCLIFFGDSVIVYGEGSYSIPGYISGLSGAVTYNYGRGGSSASTSSPGNGDLANILDDFLADHCVKEGETYRFAPDETDLTGKKLYFILNYGLNDYFEGAAVENPEDPFDINTYTGSLRSFLTEFATLFPDAEFILMTPTFTNYYSNGTEHNSEVGGSLTDYVNAAYALSKEMDVHCIDNYHDLRIDESNIWDYSGDGCHPNEDCRMLIAQHIIAFLENL